MLAGRDLDDTVVLDAAEPDAGILSSQLGEHRHRVAGDMHGPVDDPLRSWWRRRRFEPLRQRKPATEEQGEDHQHLHDRRRVDDRIRHDRIPGTHRVAGRLERRRVGRAPGEQAGPVGRRQAQRLSGQRAQPGEPDDQRGGQGDRLGPATPQAGKERRPRCQPDGVREQDQAELTEQAETFGSTQGLVDRTDGQADEQGRGRPDGNPLDPHGAEAGAEPDDEEHEQDRVIGQEVDHYRWHLTRAWRPPP